MAYQAKWIARRDEILAIASDVRTANPAAWDELKIPGQESRTYINLVSIALLEAGIPGGVNLKRGGPQESIDALAFPNDTGARDSTGTYAGLEIVDIVGGAETPNPSITWGDVTQVTIDTGNPGGWKAGSVGQTPHPPTIPSYEAMGGDEGGKKFSRILEADYKRAEKPGVDGDFGAWPWRTSYDFIAGICATVEASIAKHQPEWRKALNDERVSQGKPPIAW